MLRPVHFEKYSLKKMEIAEMKENLEGWRRRSWKSLKSPLLRLIIILLTIVMLVAIEMIKFGNFLSGW